MKQSVSELLKEKRNELGLSVKTVSEKLALMGVTISEKTLYGYESGHRTPDADTFLSLCNLYGIGTFKDVKNNNYVSDEAMQIARDYDDLDEISRNIVKAVISEEKKRRPVFVPVTASRVPSLSMRCSLQSASAGTGVYLGPEEFKALIVEENDLTRRASFAVPVCGNSMEPAYHDGDIILVEKTPELRVGEIGVFTIDNSGYVKKLGNGELISLNPNYAPVPMQEDIRCNGRVIGVLEKDWIIEDEA